MGDHLVGMGEQGDVVRDVAVHALRLDEGSACRGVQAPQAQHDGPGHHGDRLWIGHQIERQAEGGRHVTMAQAEAAQQRHHLLRLNRRQDRSR